MIAGRYALGRELGRGGMGAVWLGTDTVLGRPVALKQLAPVTAGGAPAARAEREARLAAQLNNPHLVAVFDLVVDGERPWLVMEYVEGTTLSAMVADQGPLSPDEAAGLLAQVADGLLAAHAAGIVHRDVKPSNILVTPAREVKLTDFGVARGGGDGDATITQTGMVAGSPAYLAPEVASGAHATPASDVWSLGATLFHVVTGRPPYDIGDNVLGALYRIVHEEPPRTDRAGWLEPLLLGAMTRDPAQRWPMERVRSFLQRREDRTEVLAAPAPVIAALPPTIPPPPLIAPEPGVRRPRPPRRRSPRLLAAALVAVALVAALLVLLLHGGGDNAPRHRSAASPTSSPTATSSPSSTAPSPQPTADGVRTFVTTYLQTAAADPRRGFTMLTPAFQAQSGGLAGYRSFWGKVTGIDDVRSIEPELGDNLGVSYRYTYGLRGGSSRTEEIHLRLVFANGRYLIAGD